MGENFYDAFVTKLNPAGNALIYSTFLRGNVPSGNANKVNVAYAIAVDGQGNAYVTGQTDTIDFPVTPGAHQITIGGMNDCFLMKISPSNEVIWSTYYGGTDDEFLYKIQYLDGCIYFTGLSA